MVLLHHPHAEHIYKSILAFNQTLLFRMWLFTGRIIYFGIRVNRMNQTINVFCCAPQQPVALSFISIWLSILMIQVCLVLNRQVTHFNVFLLLFSVLDFSQNECHYAYFQGCSLCEFSVQYSRPYWYQQSFKDSFCTNLFSTQHL